MYSESLLMRFILDMLKSSLVDLNNCWEFDWCWARVFGQTMFGQSNGSL